MTRVCHYTSAHRASDTRIFLKECRSLAKAGYEVFLVAQHEKTESIDGVQIIPVKPSTEGRLYRIFIFTWLVFRKALNTKSSIYHFHDPELIPTGILLRLLGKKVIFDIHENIARQLKNKSYLPFPKTLSFLYGLVDWISAKLFFIILAESSYTSIYKKWTTNYAVVQNMPDLKYLEPFQNQNRVFNERIELFYVGGVTFERGIKTIVNALHILKSRGVDVIYHCVGPYEESVMEEIRRLPAFDKVKENIHFYGRKRLDMALEVSRTCHVGLSILMPIENYLESYSTKIFEYMAIGLPVITSDFKLYRDVIESHRSGFCVDPQNSELLADRIYSFTTNPTQIKKMGVNGIEAAQKYYNWIVEEQKLTEAYRTILD